MSRNAIGALLCTHYSEEEKGKKRGHVLLRRLDMILDKILFVSIFFWDGSCSSKEQN